MVGSLAENIERYGGKHGGLLHFRENVEGGRDVVPPFELLDPGQRFSWGTRRSVWAACRDADADRVIIRTSEQSDWKGMVDTMPTVTCEKGSLSIMMAIAKVRKQCEDQKLLRYAENEGNEYDPGRVTVSIAPYFPATGQSPRILATQHPSVEGVNLIDVIVPSSAFLDWPENHSYDFDEKNNLAHVYFGTSQQSYAAKALALSRIIESTGELPKDEAFQFEGGIVKGNPMLFQIRQFADRRKADFQLDQARNSQLRDFGVTPKEGVVLEVVRVETRDQFAAFEANNPGVKYLLVLERATNKLALTDQPKNMSGYMIKVKPALSHQATRLVQMSLRNPHGVASLFSADKMTKLQDGSKVRIIADGIRQRIEKVD